MTRRGRIRRAHGGTLVLDDVDTLPPDVQGKLVRVLQTRVVEPLGALRSSLDELERFLGQSGGGEQGRLLAREICESADALAGSLGRLAASLEADPAGSGPTTLRARGRPDGAEPER